MSLKKLIASIIIISNAVIALAIEVNPDNETPYHVLIKGKPVKIYQASVYDPCCGIPSYGGPYWFCSFEVSGETTVEIVTSRSLDKLKLLPESKGVIPNVSGKKISININKPMQLVLEPDGKNGPLLLFANPPEVNVPKEGDPNVIYYGPGEHKAGAIELTDNQTLYLAEGAVVSGGIHAKGKNITIRGRGVLDGIAYARGKGPVRYPVFLEDCQNVTVEGIVIKDSWIWTFVPRGCKGVYVDNVKSLSPRVENGDGFDITNSQDVTIVNSFVRSDDDCIAIKGMGAANGQANENIRVENCILWSDKAHVWRIGCESTAEAFRNLVFKNIDVLHFPDWWTWDEVPFCISIEPGDDLLIENVLFQDIRIRTQGQRGFIDVRPKVTMWAKTSHPGRINAVTFRNISFSGPEGVAPGMIRICGPHPDHLVSNIAFENVKVHNIVVSESYTNLAILGTTKNITFSGSKSAETKRVLAEKGVNIKTAPRHRQLQLIEALKPRCVIYAKGGNSGEYKSAIGRLQKGFIRKLGVQVPVNDKPFPASSDGQPMIFIGDSPEAKDAGLDGTLLSPGEFEIKTSGRGVFITGNGEGLKSGVDTFLEHFLGADGKRSNSTDLIVGPVWITSASKNSAE
jgi:hypothetical protein